MLHKFGSMAGLVSLALGVGVLLGSGVHPAAQGNARVLEVRRYTTHEGKHDLLIKRMRDGEVKLFEKHGMKSVFYSVPADAPDSQNIFLYVLAHKSREAAKQSWDGFRNDPAWKALRDASEVNGPLVMKVESTFVNPTDFSPLK